MNLRRVYILVFLFCLARHANAIYSGTVVNYTAYPFFASIVLGDSLSFTGSVWVCGASLVSPSLLITAAHCVHGAVAAYIYLNSTIMLSPGWTPAPGVITTALYIDPSYSPLGKGTGYYDVGFVGLPHNSTITPLVVGSASQYNNVSSCTLMDILGRGQTCANGCLSNSLRHVQLPKVPPSSCIGSDYATQWTPSVVGADLCFGWEGVCYNLLHSSEMTCPGDSGGPLTLNNTIYGVVSRGSVKSCGTSYTPDIFTSLVEPATQTFVKAVVAGAYNLSNITLPAYYGKGGGATGLRCSAALGLVAFITLSLI